MRAVLTFFCACAFASCATNPRLTDDPAFRQLDRAIMAYVAAHPHHAHPIHKKDVIVFATKHQIPLDLSQFEMLEWYPSRHYLQINWKSRSNPQGVITFYSDEPI